MLSAAYGGEARSRSNVYELYKRFKEGRENEEHDESNGQESHRTDENVEKVRNLVHSDVSVSVKSV
jgi:hypothetical protein